MPQITGHRNSHRKPHNNPKSSRGIAEREIPGPTLSLPQQVDNGASGPLSTVPPPMFLTNTYLEILFLTCSQFPPLWRDGDGQLAIRVRNHHM
jgi:hypothetical protein